MYKYFWLIFFIAGNLSGQNLPETYTLVTEDYELVGNGRYYNFDIRKGKEEQDPVVILKKLNTILFSRFNIIETDRSWIVYEIYDGSVRRDSMELFVENNKLRSESIPFPNNAYIALGGNTTLDICTWNIEFYPKTAETPVKVKEIIIGSGLDLFGLQEIANSDGEFDILLSELGPEYGGHVFMENNYDQNLAFIYKKDEIEVIGEPRLINELSDSYSFPRTPAEIRIRHSSGREVVVINNHLKCCSGVENENRRRSASEKLKQYVDDNYKQDHTRVVILGDLNDRIDSEESKNVFQDFIDDSNNYLFADELLSEESVNSYYWPNIDHIIINSNLFDAYVSDGVKLDENDFIYPFYRDVSDHFPVWVNLNAELLGTDINYTAKNLEIVPNPVSNTAVILNIPEPDGVILVKVFNVQGQQIMCEKTSSKQMDVSGLKSGIYYLKINRSEKIYSGKLIIE